jgi:hypothetical protein
MTAERDQAVADILAILQGSPWTTPGNVAANVYDRVVAPRQADAWDEGLYAGKVLAAQAIGPGPVQQPVNPYGADGGAA